MATFNIIINSNGRCILYFFISNVYVCIGKSVVVPSRLYQFIMKRAASLHSTSYIWSWYSFFSCMWRFNRKNIPNNWVNGREWNERLNCKITRYQRPRTQPNEIFILWSEKSKSIVCVLCSGMQIENVFKFAMLFIWRFFIPFVCLFCLSVAFCVFLCSLRCAVFLFYYLVVSSKAIYWFDLRSFPNRILLCVFSSVHIGIQLFFVVVGLVIDCYCMQFCCCCCICSCWERERESECE